MAPSYFDRAVFVQRSSLIEEIACLEEAFDFLDDWPDDRRDLAYEALYGACRKAANGLFPLDAARENLERFARRAGLLGEIEDVPSFFPRDGGPNVGSD